MAKNDNTDLDLLFEKADADYNAAARGAPEYSSGTVPIPVRPEQSGASPVMRAEGIKAELPVMSRPAAPPRVPYNTSAGAGDDLDKLFDDADKEYSRQTATPTTSAPVPSRAKSSLLGEFGKGVATGTIQFGEMAGGLAALAGAEDVGGRMIKASQETAAPYQAAVPSYKEIDSVRDALLFAAHGLGTIVPTAAVAAVTGGVGAAIGKGIAQKALVRELGAEGVKAVGMKEIRNQAMKSAMRNRLAVAGAVTGMTAVETGGIGAAQLEKGEGMDPFKAITFGTAAAVLDVFPEWALAKRLGILTKVGKDAGPIMNFLAGPASGNWWKRAAKDAARQFALEAPTEGMQTILEKMGAGERPFDKQGLEEIINSFLIGGIGALVFGGIGGVFTKPERDQKVNKVIGQVGQVPTPSVTGEEGPNWPGASAIPATGMFGIKTSKDKAAAPAGAVSDIVPGVAGPTVEPTGSIEGMEALLRSYFGDSEPTIKLINESVTKGPNVFSSVSVVDPFYDYGPDEEGQLPLELTTNRGFPISIKWDKAQAKYVPWGYREPGDGADEWRKIPVGREWFQKVFDFEKISPVEPTSRTRNIIPTQQIKTLKEMSVPVKFDMSKTTDMAPTAAPAAVTPAAAPIVAAPTVTEATQMLPDPATILTGTVDEVRAVFGIEDDAAAMSFLEKSSLKDTGAGVHYRATSDRVKRTLAPDMASPTPMGSERNLGTFRTPVSYVYNKPSDKEAVIMHRNEMYLVPLTGDLLTFKSPEYKAYRDRASTLVVKEGGAPGDEGLIHHRALKLMAEEGKFAGIDSGARQGLKLTKASPVIPVTTNVLEGMVNSIKSNDGGDFNLFFGRNALPAWSVSLSGNRTGSVRTGRLNVLSLRDFITSGDNHTLFAKPQFNLSAKVEGDRINLSVNFLTNDKQQAITEGLQRGLKSIENTATGEIIHMKDWTLRNGEAVLKGSAKARGFGFNNQPDGGNITTPVETYANAEQTGNVWVRQSNNRSNSGRTLLVQFSTTILTSEIEPEAQAYYDKLYAGTRQGYVHPKDFWEIPHWMAIAARSVKQSDVYVVRDVQEAITFLNSAGYDNVAFSALSVNKELIKQIAGAYKGNIVAGGYVDMKEFSGFSNVKTYDFIQNFIQDLGLSVQPGTDYRHFENTEIVPRLKMSQGCLSRCAFCSVTPHGKIIQTEASDIKAQVQAFKSLKAKLVYLDDKTFGQAKNYTMLKDIYQDMKSFNPDFDGFIIQTSAAQMHNLTPEFIRDAGIKYIELGIESFNDPILRAMKKPASEAIILKSIQKIREAGAYLIPNIVIGFPQETAETYARTMQFLRDHRSIISHGNIYNLAVYSGTQLEEQVGPLSASDIDENKIRKSFHTNPEIHKKFSDEVFEFMNRRLDDQLRFVDATQQGRGPEGVSYRIGPLYHGTNRDFARFMLNHVGSGEGSQAYGHGLYFTTAKDIAEYYAMATDVKGMHKLGRAKRSQVVQPWLKQINEARERIGAEQYGAVIQDIAHFVAQDLGHPYPFPMYLSSEPLSLKISDLDLTDVSKRIVKEVDLHAGKDPGQYTYLDWDKPAPDVLVSRVTNHLSTTYGITEDFKGFGDAPRGSNLYEITRSHFRNLGNSFVDANKLASAILLELGVDGIRVPAGYTLGKAQPGQFTYVVFDPDEITVRNSISFRRSNIIDVKGGNFFKDNMEFQRMLRMVPPNLGVRVVQSLKDVDIRVRPFERRDDAAVAPITALYDRGGKTGTPQIFIIMDSVTSMKQLQTSFIHEVVGHYGLEQYLGDKLEPFLQMVLAKPNLQVEFREIARAYGLDLDYFPDRIVAAEEYLAFRAEDGENASLMEQFYAYIRQALRWLGFSKLELTDAEIRTALVRSRQIYWTNNAKARTTGWSARAVKGDVWFSQLQRVIDLKMPSIMDKSEFMRFIRSQGVKEDEIKWTGLEDWLAKYPGEGRVKKENVSFFLQQNRVKVEEVVKGLFDDPEPEYKVVERPGAFVPFKLIINGEEFLGWEHAPSDEEIAHEIKEWKQQNRRVLDTSKFEKWTLPGGKNYRELLLTLPGSKAKAAWTMQLDEAETGVGTYGSIYNIVDPSGNVIWNDYEPQARAYIEDKNKSAGFRSPHWDEPNVLAHVRFNERTGVEGNRILFIEEVQSDWHQAGREKGYQAPEGTITPEERAQLADRGGGVPLAPFSKTWHELMMKRMVRWAAENGFDRVAWTTGKQQAERYDLQKHVSKISYDPTDNKLYAYDMGGKEVIYQFIEGDNPKAIRDRIGDYIGDELAGRLLDKVNNQIDISEESGWSIKENTEDDYSASLTRLKGLEVELSQKLDAAQRAEGEVLKHGTADMTADQIRERRLVLSEKSVQALNALESVRDKLDDLQDRAFVIYDPNGEPLYSRGDILETFPSRKSAAQYLRQLNVEEYGRSGMPSLTGLDLKVGGEGMIAFYDKILVAYMNKFGKRWGVKVDTVGIDLGTIASIQMPTGYHGKMVDVHSLTINDDMKQSVMAGQPLFRREYRKHIFTPSTLPSDVSQGDNVQQHNTWLQNYKDRKENFTNPLVKDLPRWQEILGLPHWIAKDFQQFEPVTNVQWDRLDKRNADRVMLTRDPESNQGDNFYLTLTDPSRVNQLIVDSDANDIYYSTDADLVARATEMGISLTGDDVKAYHAWKAGMDKAIDYSLNKMRHVTTRIYSDQTWGSMIMDIINGNLDINTIPFDNEKDRKEVLSAVKATQVRLDKVTELETKLRSMNFYMPRVREKGNFVVRVFTTSPEGKVMEMFSDRRASMTAAEALRKQVAADPMWAGMTVTKTEEKPTAEFIHEGMNVVALQAFLDRGIERAQQKHGMDDETANMIFDSVVQSMDEEILARGFRSHHIRRFKSRVIAGYQVKDLQRVFVDYMSGLAGGMSKFEASYDFFKAIGNIDAKTQPNLFQYAGRYMGDMLRNPDATDQIIGKLKSIPFAWYLVSNLRMAAAQFSQNFMTAAPILSRSLKQWGVGGSGATARIVNAMKDVAAKSNLTPEEVQMLDQAMNQGETTANQINEMMGRIEGGWVQQSWGKVMKVASLPFSGMEKLNRQSALLASFRAAREAGKTYEEAYAAAKTFVRDTHYAYGKSNLPQLLREGTTFSKIAGAAYTFRSFTHNYLLSMAYYMKTPDGKLAFDVIGRSFAFMALIGGAVAVPFIDDILDLLEKETGTPYRVHMRRALEGAGGKLLGDVGMQGLPALIGVDISGSIKVGVPFLGDTRNTVYGVWGGLLDKGNNAIDNVLKGDILRAVEAVAPTGLESPFKALRQATEGVTTGKGKPLLGPTGEQIKLTTPEAIAQAGSFRPARIAQVQQERRVQANITEAFNGRRQDIYQQMRKAKTSEDYSKLSKEVQKFNMDVQKYRGSIAPISMQTLKQAMQPEKSYMKFKRTA